MKKNEEQEEWRSRYEQILCATDKLLHEIRFCCNAEELWRMVGMSHKVEDLHTRVIDELDALDRIKHAPETETP